MARADRKKTNPIVLQAGMSIGTNAAEFDDEFLLECFVHYSHIDEPLLPLAQITDDARVRIHPMLWGSYRMQ